MHSHVRAIIFDLGGVLLDWNPRNLYRRFFTDQPQEMENFLTEISFADWNAQQDKGRPFEEGITELSAHFPQYSHLIQAYFDNWEESISGPILGSVEILQMLNQRNYPLFGLSNWSAETYPRVRNKYPFFDLFDNVVISGEVKHIKPEPAIFKLLLKKSGYSASECVLIDDSQANINAARELGFSTIHFTSPEKLKIELQLLKLL